MCTIMYSYRILLDPLPYHFRRSSLDEDVPAAALARRQELHTVSVH